MGASWGQCTACPAGTFNAVRGSSECGNCPAGTYMNAVGGTTCFECGNLSTSAMGSTEAGSCHCTTGSTGPDGGLCTQCPAGTYKAVDGSSPCLQCPPGSSVGQVGARSLEACECDAGFVRGGSWCVPRVTSGPSPVCFQSDVTLGDECPVAYLTVSGCAASPFDVGAHTLQVRVGATERSLPPVTTSCEGFWSWMCERFDTERGDNVDCSFYCALMTEAVSAEMAAGCSSDSECWAGSTIFDFDPVPGSLCLPAARYALASSCLVPARRQTAFLADVDAFLAESRESCSSSDSTEMMTATNAGPGPNSLTDTSCYDTSDCDYACFTSDWTFYREFSLISIQSSYVGSCDCSVRGLFRGHIEYQDGVRITAANGFGQNFTSTATRSINQIQAQIEHYRTRTCDHAIEDEVSEIYFWFENAFHPEFLPPSAAVQNGTSAGMASALLRPWDGKAMVLDVGPDVCAYKWEVSIGMLLGVGQAPATTIPTSGLAGPLAAEIVLLPVPANTLGGLVVSDINGECSDIEACAFRCITSGLATVTGDGDIVGRVEDRECSCDTLEGAEQNGALAIPPWTFTLHAEIGLFRYTFAPSSCWGFLNVSGGSFMGAPASIAPSVGDGALVCRHRDPRPRAPRQLALKRLQLLQEL